TRRQLTIPAMSVQRTSKGKTLDFWVVQAQNRGIGGNTMDIGFREILLLLIFAGFVVFPIWIFRKRTTETDAEQKTRVVVADFDMPFGSMVSFMVKWAIAAIPALIILSVIGFFVMAFLAGVFGYHGRF